MALNFLELLIGNKELSLIILLLVSLNYFLYKHFTKVVKGKDVIIKDKDGALLTQSVKVIKLMTLWEQKSDNSTEAIVETNKLLTDIREALIAKGIINP